MLNGKEAVVTGSTSGIGLGIAQALAQQGAGILLNGFGDRSATQTFVSQMSSEYFARVTFGISMVKCEAQG